MRKASEKDTGITKSRYVVPDPTAPLSPWRSRDRSETGIPPPACQFDGPVAPCNGAMLVGRTVAEVERELILETLKRCGGNRTHSAHMLGISIRTLRNKLSLYGADGADIPPANSGGEHASS